VTWSDVTSSTAPQGGSTPHPPLSPFRIGLLVLVLVTAAWRWWTSSHWSWFADDWIYLDQTQSMGFLEYVFQGYNSHLMPGQFLLTWIITEAAPLNYGWAALLLTLFAVGSLIAWAAAFREIFGERVQLLLPLSLIALSPMLLMPTVWWASGIQVLPLQLSMGLSVLFLARYLLRGRRRQELVWLMLSYGAGLFFWQKALLIMIPLVLVGWLLSTGSPGRRATSLARTLGAPAVMSALYAVVYLATRRSGALAIPRTEFAPRSLVDWWQFISTSARDVGLPLLAGGPFERMTDAWDTYAPVSAWQALTLTGLFIGAAAVTVVLRRNSVPAVGCLVVYALVTWGLVVTSARFILDGSEGMGRYAADILPVAGLVIAFITTRTVLEPDGTALRRQLPRPVMNAGRVVLGAVGACIVAAMLVVNTTTWWVARESTPRPWVDAVVADSKRAGDATIVNVSAPVNVIHPILFMEYASLSRMLGPLHLPLKFDEPSPLLLVPDDGGHLMEADVVDLAAKNRPTDNPTCGFLVRPGRTTTIPMTLDLYPFGWGVRLDYFAELPTEVQVRTDSAQVDLDLAAGLRRVQFKVAGAITSIQVSAPDSATPVCVTQVFIGGFGASDRTPWQ
jgi:hypothetical protein